MMKLYRKMVLTKVFFVKFLEFSYSFGLEESIFSPQNLLIAYCLNLYGILL
ncbi:hypothetical protein SAMN05421825_3444 [Epilithonimonas hungarica]|uniref:Uncharacterized protein n=1 Tax=Epilithonimonas hungarica TaxID=454006 RepID=A0A1G7UK72_9FLAO|nr:hypothetical protein SAMN05421825_3444 [Epilithonimonas hungarica]